jgi:hypothetical protein
MGVPDFVRVPCGRLMIFMLLLSVFLLPQTPSFISYPVNNDPSHDIKLQIIS